MADEKVNTPQKTNALAVIGLVSAFFVPLIGLVLSTVGLTQINKKKEKGKGLAIAGIVTAVIVGFLQIVTIGLIFLAVRSSSLTLVSYSNNDIGYTVQHPKGWKVEPESQEGAQGMLFKGDPEDTGKVSGQVEVVYLKAPKNGYKKDVLNAIRDALKNDNPNTKVEYVSRQSFKGLDSIRMLISYDGENGRVKSKVTVILNKDNSVYTLATQAPEQNWKKLQDAFDEIHNTFEP